MAIMQNELFNDSPEQANVVVFLLTKFREIYENDRTASKSAPTMWQSIKSVYYDNSQSDPRKYILAKAIGTIVNGADKIPNDAVHTIDTLFLTALEVSWDF